MRPDGPDEHPPLAALLLVAALWAPGCTCGSQPAVFDQPPAGADMDAASIEALVDGAQRMALGDLEGDGKLELVLAKEGVLRVVGLNGQELGRVSKAGKVDVLEIVEVDGSPMIVSGWGQSRAASPVTARVYAHRLEGQQLVEEQVGSLRSERPEIAAIAPHRNDEGTALLIAWFESKYVVRLTRATFHTEWHLQQVGSFRMATSLAVGDVDGDGSDDIVMGRLYGDAPGQDGDAFILRPDSGRTPLPVTRGVRALTIADMNGDGVGEILAADGWHQNYGQHARALLTEVTVRGGIRAAPIEEAPGQFGLWDVQAADLDGDGQLEIVTRGNAHVRVVRREPSGWSGTTVHADCHDVVTADLTPSPGDELLLSCADGAHLVEWDGLRSP